MTEDATKPTLDETYTRARNSKDLTVSHSDLPNRDSDVLAAAAWTQSRAGHLLMQLHSEWDAAEKPARPTRIQIQSMVGTSQCAPQGIEPDLDDNGNPRALTLATAKAYADAWHRHEVGLLLGKLKTLPAVRRELAEQAAKWGWAEPLASSEVLRWWLDQSCHACHGTKFQFMTGTRRLGDRPCGECRGSGHSRVPHGQQGTKLANWMDEGVNIARRRIRKALQNYRKPD